MSVRVWWFLSRLPPWLRWYLAYGLEDKSGRAYRRQMTTNILMTLAVVTSLIFASICLLFDLALWPTSLVGLSIAAQFFVIPLMHKRTPIGGTVFMILFSGLAFPLQSYLTGKSSGIYLYLFLVTAVILAMNGTRRLLLLLLGSAFNVVGVLCSLYLFPGPGLEAANDPVFQTSMMTFTVLMVALLFLGFGYVAFNRAERAEDALQAEHARSEALLYNLLPEDIAARLKIEPDQTIADSLPHVAILFADIVDFTPRTAKLPPEEVVEFLNRIFRAFDELAEKRGLEKIKTIGDAYMVAAGMPNPCGDPVHRVAEMALDMQQTVAQMSKEFPEGLQVRIGLHAGPAVAGVIGNRKLFYDVWGETVNTASRMESHGQAGRIQVTTAAKEELEDGYDFELRGTVEVKGMGEVETWWLSGKHPEQGT